jgi:demethylmenaquinone methyltransferase/2-methoxy-6-polyprenyl-1,4-benzoquinol methylase
MDRYIDRAFVQQRFRHISPWYDFLNSLLSFGLDHYWRWQAVKKLKGIKGIVLDLCAGTLPLSKALVRYTNFRGQIIALDFCQLMLIYGQKKWPKSSVWPVCGDALCLPLKDRKVEAVMVAFGVRNFTNPLVGLKEMCRVLTPGGKAIILEFSHPYLPLFKRCYFLYLKHLLPKIGGLISKDKEAYKYLADSIERFYQPHKWVELMEKAGFKTVRYEYLTGGIVSIYIGVKR